MFVKGSSWLDIASSFLLGLGITVPSFLTLALAIIVYNKVVKIRLGKDFARQRKQSDLASGSSRSWTNNAESRKNNEAVTIIAMLSVYHFFTYMPASLVATARTSIGFLFSSSVLTLLAGINLYLVSNS